MSSLTPDTLSLDSSTVSYTFQIDLIEESKSHLFNYFFYSVNQSAESKEQRIIQTNIMRRGSENDDNIKGRLSEDESNDSAFADNGNY